MKLNVFYGIGNLTRDSEIKTMPNGKTKQVFNIAINDDYKKAGTEEWIKRQENIRIHEKARQLMEEEEKREKEKFLKETYSKKLKK